MRMIFEWIKCDEKNLFNDCGINFTDDFEVSYDSKTRVLSIKKIKSKIPQDFYSLNGSNVVNQVTCIVGKNGSGKTSLLKHIYGTDLMDMRDEISERYPYWSTIQVMEYAGNIFIYHNQENLTVESDDTACQVFQYLGDKRKNLVSEILEDGNYAHTTKIFISNDYYVALNQNMTMKGYQQKIAFTPYDLSVIQSGFLERVAKIQRGIIVLRNPVYYFNNHLRSHTNKQNLQNVLYCLLLRAIKEQNLKKEFKYLNDIKITFQRICKSDAFIEPYGLYRLIIGRYTHEKIIYDKIEQKELEQFANSHSIVLDKDLLKICAVHAFVIDKFSKENETIDSNLTVNLITEILLALLDFELNICNLDSYEIEDLLQIFEKNISSKYKDNDDVIKLQMSELEYYQEAYRSITKLKSYTPCICEQNTFVLDDESRFLDYIYEELEAHNGFVFKYFWLSYGCSAGERAYLNIFSYLNAILNYRLFSDSAVYGFNKNILLFLDEPDLYCHPEWQRKMMFEIIKMLELLYSGYSFHIILTTHSPLFLSDIPKENILLLKESESGGFKVTKCEKPTFGANIFDLYSDNFFLVSFIGEFAQHKIGNAIKQIAKCYNQEDSLIKEQIYFLEDVVELIGEPILKNKLKNMLKYIKERNQQ